MDKEIKEVDEIKTLIKQLLKHWDDFQEEHLGKRYVNDIEKLETESLENFMYFLSNKLKEDENKKRSS